MDTVSSIPSTVPSLNPIDPVTPPVPPRTEARPPERVRSTPPAGVGETVDVQV
jgi:hypothetical protein